MNSPGPRGWQPAGFIAHVQDVLGDLNRRHDRRVVLRAFLDLPSDWTTADAGILPRAGWRAPHGQNAEALGVAKLCPLTELRWQGDAPHSDDLAELQAWLGQAPMLTDALLACGSPVLRDNDVVVPLQLWVPRLWLTAQSDGRVEARLVLLGEDQPDVVLAELQQMLEAARPVTRHVAPLTHEDTTPASDEAIVAGLVAAMRAGEAHKVVWSQTLPLTGQWPRGTLAQRMRAARPEAWVVDVELTDQHNALCATPELLVRCEADRVMTMALAGTGSTRQLKSIDPRLGDEHGRVRDFVRDRLVSLGVEALELQSDIAQAGPLSHRRTQLTGRRPPQVDALTAALTLHPTPALLGLPRRAALTLLQPVESTRGLYGGCFGRIACDGSGEGEVVVLLRGIRAATGQWHARAGAGLVPQSVAADEVAEIGQKFAAILQSLQPEAP